MIDRCEFCKFWRRRGETQRGRCYFNPPAIDKTGENRWPVAKADDWCGQYEESHALDDAARERWSEMKSEEAQEQMRKAEKDRQQFAEIARRRSEANAEAYASAEEEQDQ